MNDSSMFFKDWSTEQLQERYNRATAAGHYGVAARFARELNRRMEQS